MAKRVTKDQFKTWLESKSEKTKVGTKTSGDSPFFRFLRAENISIVDVKIPKWVEQFHSTFQNRPHNSISAKAALSILN